MPPNWAGAAHTPAAVRRSAGQAGYGGATAEEVPTRKPRQRPRVNETSRRAAIRGRGAGWVEHVGLETRAGARR